MALRAEGHVYATLLLSDTYFPGALVLAHSLRDAGTTKELAVLVTLDSVSAEVIAQLENVYDHIISVPRIRNDRPANLHLMNRPDLHSAFTKVNLWKQTQFSRIVYIDADVVAYRAPDELFDIESPFSAAPDIGWPDIFNTGVMALTPNMGDYSALMAMAERGVSFDGADQGLLNMHFGEDYNRLSFTYNVTPSAHYQYIPAYRHFRSSINMVHFIGPVKPWFQGRHDNTGDSPFDEMFGRWWAVYDRHYRPQQTTPSHHAPGAKDTPQSMAPHPAPEIVQYFTKGEFQPRPAHTGEHSSDKRDYLSHRPHDDHGFHATPSPYAPQSVSPSSESFSVSTGPQAEARQGQVPAHEERPLPPPASTEHKPEPTPPPAPTWDAQRQPPPPNSKPEAINFPQQIYQMSQDPAPFIPPARYPSPPKDMWYEIPKEKPAIPSRPAPAIFPWEGHQPRPSRIFTEVSSAAARIETSTTGQTSEDTAGPATPTTNISSSIPWSNFSRSNAWDEVPEIERYVEGLQKHRRTKSQETAATTSTGKKAARERGLRLTDFPSEVDRPSLPVTPAPVRGPKLWGRDDHPGAGAGAEAEGEEDGEEPLPTAPGVPPQADWDPSVQLQKLAKQQSDALLRRLESDVGESGGGAESSSRRIPNRPLPFGSDNTASPTYASQPPTGVLFSPRPLKGGETTSVVRNMGEGSGYGSSAGPAATTAIADPSVHGPDVAWEKGEGVPSRETGALEPSEEQRDVLDG